MAEYALTNRAAQDLTEIYRFSVQQFGARVAGTYLNALDLRVELRITKAPGHTRSAA